MLYFRDQPFLNDHDISEFADVNVSDSFNFKLKKINRTNLSNFWRTLKMMLINCQVNLILTWSVNFVIKFSAADPSTTFAITGTKLYVSVLTSSSQDNANYYNN